MVPCEKRKQPYDVLADSALKPELIEHGIVGISRQVATDYWVAERLYRISRMVTDNFENMGDYVANLIQEFQDVRRCTVYQAPSDIFASESAARLEHRVTVRFEDGRVIKDEKGGTYSPAPDDPVLSVFMDKNPVIYDLNPGAGLDYGIKVVFEDLDRNSNRYHEYRIPQDPGGSMMAIMPFYYRESENLSGVAVFEGDLRGKYSILEGFGRAYWAAKLAMSESAQISAALTHRYDAITNLPRRKDFEIDLREGIRSLIKQDINGLYLMFIDIDDFKRINDIYTHPIGDEVIRKVAEHIESCVRSRDMTFRLGGEEFGVILSGVSDTTAMSIAERIRQSVESIEVWVKKESDNKVRILDGPDPEGELVTVRISIGVADVRHAAGGAIGSELPQNGMGDKIIQDIFSSAYKRSAELLHEAKHRGKNCIFYTNEGGSASRLII